MLTLISNWHLRRSAIRQLARLSDRELADLGIRRSDIAEVASLAVEGAGRAMRHAAGAHAVSPSEPAHAAYSPRALAA